jgi:hypothetical protein
MSERKAKFRDHLDQFAKQYFGEPTSRLNEKQRSDALVLCYLLSVRNALLPGSVPDDFEELQSYISDAQYDRTADFIYRDDSNHVTIIQGNRE